MKRIGLGVALLVAGLLANVSPASAGIHCSSHSYSYWSRWYVCYVTCVYCEDAETGEILSEYCSEECWSRVI
ncbi:MAG TPA: hypothetical protein VGS22_28970 [Thermoanaerobaculia bacterium]|jgi:hypothetical protein|nr:hypothetical protein [Thermoanaerobaculia bacterium]